MADHIAKWLDELGIGQYAQSFVENDIDFEVAEVSSARGIKTPPRLRKSPAP